MKEIIEKLCTSFLLEYLGLEELQEAVDQDELLASSPAAAEAALIQSVVRRTMEALDEGVTEDRAKPVVGMELTVVARALHTAASALYVSGMKKRATETKTGSGKASEVIASN